MKKGKEFRMLNPRLDANFKAIFTQDCEDSRIALRSFLSAMIGEPVTAVTVRENEEAKQYDSQRGIRYDIKCEFEDGTKAQVEMQGYDEDKAYDKRAEYYAARLVSSVADIGDDWKNLPKAYQISVLNFKYDTGNLEPLHHYTMTDGSNGATLAGILNVIFLELPKLPPVDERTDIESLPSAVKWGTFIKEADNPEKQDLIDRLTRSEKGIMGAQAVLRKMDEDGWRFFEEGQRIVDCIDRNTALNNAERRGIAKGREEDIRNLMANLSLSAEQAMDALGIPADERDKYSALLA